MKVFLRDWYYNAGIIGFLKVISDGERNINNIKNRFSNDIEIGNNFIEFNPDFLKNINFFEKFKKLAFCKLFEDNFIIYKERLKKFINKIKTLDSDNKFNKKIFKDFHLEGKIISSFFETIYKKVLENFETLEELIENTTQLLNKLENFGTVEDLYNSIYHTNFIDYFLKLEIEKKICSYTKIDQYIGKILKIKEGNNKNQCFICGKYKREFEFNNAITQILGFNKDNSNWVWGFTPQKLSICSLCALIYACALQSMVFIKKEVQYIYFLNFNANIETLYNSYWLFAEKIKDKKNYNKPFYVILREIVFDILKEKSFDKLTNINFIEIKENELSSKKSTSKSTKSYNIYNYNISRELAQFIYNLEYSDIPEGLYKTEDITIDIKEEILQKMIENRLSYNDLNYYIHIYLQSFNSDRTVAIFSIFKVVNFILKYIRAMKGGITMSLILQEDLKKISDKAFFNGRDLASKIEDDKKIKSIAYQLLNDLKIADKNAFLDKYLRLSMSYDMPVKLGSNQELIDIDKFLQFGYSFVNGLLNYSKDNKEVSNG